MSRSEVLNGKLILAVDDEEDVLQTIEDLLSDAASIDLHVANSFERGWEYLVSYTYDVVILDIMGVRGFELLQLATRQNFPAVMLTAHALDPESLKKSIELGARAYLPKEKLYSLVPFLEDVLKLSYQSTWKKAMDHVAALFDKRFGSDWRKSESEFWKDFEKSVSMEDGAIIK